MTPRTCAAPGCDNPVPRPLGPGRPPIYCAATCRPSKAHPATSPITVGLAHDADATGTAGWTITLHRGPRTVVIASNLGRFAAILLRDDIQHVLHPRHHQEGAAR